MILTALPDLPPAPETAANAAFRRSFYARWGRENALVCGRAVRAEYATFEQTLSIKMATGGRERYFLAHREVSVDDDNLLVLNEGSRYGSLLAGHAPAFSFAVFFRPGMHAEVVSARQQRLGAVLDGTVPAPRAPRPFSEHLRRHDRRLTPLLQHLRAEALAGERDEGWLEQRLALLLDAMLDAEADGDRPIEHLQAVRRSTRAELARRLRLAADFIESCHSEPITLDRIAEVACLSRFHFVRHFHRFYGHTPHDHLLHKRVRAARRMLASGAEDREAVALRCGFGSRSALWRALQRFSDGRETAQDLQPAAAAARRDSGDPHSSDASPR